MRPLVNIPFLNGDVPSSPSYVYTLHLFVLQEYVLMEVTSTTETHF